ncbi:Protein fam50a [Dermatophagoides pteronyssinus]|uniref:Protein FAM50 homolog n=1 Tax=Dermatophagoides pteronyssinus TaxID=6956 RepID=A0ABQ8IY85_DERPT|nr:Protein fam50a [Dermatophagoides pteronyssinus]
MAHYKGAASEGGRALQLQKQREKALEDLELRKKKIGDELKLSNIGNKFAAHYDAIEQQIKSSTVGLVTLGEMRAKQEGLVKERERQLALKKESMIKKEIELRNEQKEKQRKQIKALSFRLDEDEDEDEEEKQNNDDNDTDNNGDGKSETDIIPNNDIVNNEDSKSNLDSSDSISQDSFNHEPEKKKRKMIKNPDVDTSFLPDRTREEEENRLREQLRQEWVEKQEKLKNEEIEITFSYWDGSGHRRSVMMKKGNTIYQFLQKSLELLRKEFHELKTVTTDQLMYIKEDLIIPHHYSFYDFIVTKARGKSGPLFSFDVHDDIRLVSDATVERDESHAGKVLLRSWYERNKHIFPASRWEPYDPQKNYEKYTIGDRVKK